MDLKKNAPKGEFLAYINKKEAAMLKKAGGSGKLVNGIPSFEPRSSREAEQKSRKTSTKASKNTTNTTNNSRNTYSVQDDLFDQSNYLKNNTVTNPSISDNDRDRFFQTPTGKTFKDAADNAAKYKADAKNRKKEKDKADKIRRKKEEIASKEREKLNLKIAGDKDLRLFDKNKDGILGFFERHLKRRNDSRKKRAAQASLENLEQIKQYLNTYDDYSLDGVAAAKARGYKVDGTGVMPKNNPKYKLSKDRNFQGARTIIPNPDYIDPNSGSVTFTGYDSNPLTNPDAINPSLGYDFRPKSMPGGEGMKTLTSNKGTFLEKTRPNLYGVNSKIPFSSWGNKLTNKIRPDTSVTAQNTLDNAALYNMVAGKDLTTTEDLREIRNRGRTEEQIRFLENPTGSGGYEAPNSYVIPFIPDDEEEKEEDKQEVDYTQNVIYDDYGKPGYRTTRAAEGGIMGTRARRAMGGIMERVDKRQGYFLGKIVKGVGKAIGSVADAAGKVLKSDFGKYAIMAAGMYYGGGGASMFKSGGLKGMAGNFMSTKNPLLFNADGALSLSKLSGVSAVLPYLFGDTKPNEGNFSDRGGSLIDPLTGKEATPAEMRENIELAKLEAGDDPDKLAAIDQKYNNMLNLQYQAGLPDATPYLGYGESGYRTTAAEGGLMDLGGMEKDYRAEGGFVPIGEYEKKDDVPARLSVNEFVMTADAVRGAGQGDIDKGAEIMENMMKNLENGGTVSEESQGNKGAQQMFETSERLGAII